MPDITLGSYHIFTVVKEEDSQYIINADRVTLALPKKDATKKLDHNEMVEVFVYANHRKQLVATMKEPKIDIHRAALVEVVEAKFGLGVFVDVGLDKDMLVSKDELPILKKQWPQIGDHVFCYLKSGRNQLSARLVSRFKMHDYFTPENTLEEKQVVEATIFHIADEGLVLYTISGHEIFVYFKHARKEHRLGETLEVTISVVKDQAHYNGSLIAQKEIMMSEDANRIMALLKAHDGEIPLGDKSDPEAIFEALHMSKASFKRALGSLYKDGHVELDKQKTRLKD